MRIFILILIRAYQLTLSRIFAPVCRFEPSCSVYTAECVKRFGAVHGLYLGCRRILRCHPWHPGGLDMPPKHKSRLASNKALALVACSVLCLSYAHASAASQDSHSIRTKNFIAHFDPKGGGLKSFKLLDRKFQVKGRSIELVTTDRPKYRPFALTIEGLVPADAAWEIKRLQGSAGIVLLWRGSDMTVERKIEPGRGDYQLWSTTRLINNGSQGRKLTVNTNLFHYVSRQQEKGGFFAAPAPTLSHGSCLKGDELERLDREALLKTHRFSQNVKYSAVENQYFVFAATADQKHRARCVLKSSNRGGTASEPHGSLFLVSVGSEIEVPPRGDAVARSLLYAGPKKAETLRAAGHQLHRVVDLGFFAVIGQALVDLLAFIHRFVSNWGLAIILLTLMVKLALYPLTEKSFQSMAKLRTLKPELDRINSLYANDREKKGAAMMELYRRHKINPMGGCLPQLLQLPIWWALYTSLSTNIELYNAPFAGWLQDLSAPDPYFVLPVLLGGLMVVQQKMTPTAMDPMQAKMMLYFMPAFLTAIMLFLPAGLCLYMATNQVLSLVQQRFIDWRLTKKNSMPADATHATSAGSEQAVQARSKT